MTNDEGHPLSGLRPTPVPEELSERVLGAAREALAQTRAPSRWDRLWESRPLRLAWAVSTAVLLLAHLTLSVAVRPAAETAASAHLRIGQDEEELREILNLPRTDHVALGPDGTGTAAPSPPARPEAGKRRQGVES